MSYTMYTPLNVWLDPASVTDVVAYIQTYLSENTIYSETEIEAIIHDYLIAHPELIGGVQSVNGKTGTVVLSASDINTEGDVTIESVLASLSSQISSIAASVATNTNNITSLTGRVSTAETDLSNLKSTTSSLEEVSETAIPFTISDDSTVISYTDGTTSSVNNASITDYIDVSEFSEIRYRNVGKTGSSALYGMAFYDSEKIYITGIAAIPGQSALGYVSWDTIISVPSNAVYARFTTLTNTTTQGSFYLYGRTTAYNEATSSKNAKQVFRANYFEGSIGNSSGIGASRTGVFRSGYLRASESCVLTMTATPTLWVSMYKYTTNSQSDFVQQVFFHLSSSHKFWVEKGAFYRYEVRNSDGTGLSGVSATDVVFTCSSDNHFLWRDSDQNFFYVTINTTSQDDASMADSETNVDVDCALMLPTAYDPIGAPVPLVFLHHGASATIDSTNRTWCSEYANFYILLNSICNAGYAVFDINGYGNSQTSGTGYDYGCPLAMQAFMKAYEYITHNYNVETKVFACGYSMGGITACTVAKTYPDIVRAVGLLNPAMLFASATKESASAYVATAFGYASASDMASDGYSALIPSLIGMDYYNANGARAFASPDYNWVTNSSGYTIILHDILCPIKSWCASSDAAVDPDNGSAIVTAMHNANRQAYTRTVDGDHTTGGGGNSTVNSELVMWLNRFV